MKLKTIVFILLLMGLNAFSQINYEKGYVITNDGTTMECFIKNEGWLNTPDQFRYKNTSNSDQIIIGTTKDIKEFGIKNVLKYKRFDVDIDMSGTKINTLSSFRQSQFSTKTLFLKMLVDGDAKLFSYQKSGLIRFFYKKGKEIKQLEYKLYKDSKNRIGKNLNYLKQLRDNLPCEKITVKNIQYKEKDLVDYFIKYNSFNNTSQSMNVVNYTIKNKQKSRINFYVKLGINFSKLHLFLPGTLANEERKADFDLKTTFAPGFEIEYQLPFNNNKWALFIDPSYQSYKSEVVQNHPYYSYYNRIYNVNYKSIELPIGVRHYLFLNNQKTHVLLFNVGLTIDIPFNSLVTERYNSQFSPPITSTISFKFNPRFFLGMGYMINEKYKLEFRYNKRTLNLYNKISNYQIPWQSNYDTFSVVFSYNLL